MSAGSSALVSQSPGPAKTQAVRVRAGKRWLSAGVNLRLRKRLRQALRASLMVAAMGSLAIVGEAWVRARLVPNLADSPTRFYSRPIELRRGVELDTRRVEETLQRLGYTSTRRNSVAIGEYHFDSRRLVVGRRAFRVRDRLDPGGVTVVTLGRDGYVIGVADQRGRPVGRVTLEPELLGSPQAGTLGDRIPVSLAGIPDHVVQAVISIEDRRFFQHGGTDMRRIGGAMLANARAGRVVQGGSTITQQLAKNLFLSPRRSLVRKVREMAMALMLEMRYSKDRILEAYLNEIYLGQDGGLEIHGVGRAAQFYFGRDVSQLEVQEAALLAGIIRGPNLYSPSRNQEAAVERRNVVLRAMEERDIITSAVCDSLSALPLQLSPARATERVGRYFVDYAATQLAEVAERHGPDNLSVFTTVDMGLQLLAEESIREGLARLEAYYPRLSAGDGEPLQAALVAIDPHTGEILAMVGGRDYGQSQFNRAATALRQPGSSFKPIVALAALARPDRWGDESELFTLASTLQDRPLAVVTPAGLWEPNNYDGQFRGAISLREALEYSLNVPFARLGMEVGAERIVETARNLGIESSLNPVPSLALGSSEVTLLEMTRAFGVLAAGGVRAGTHATLGVLDGDGNLIDQPNADRVRVYDPAEAYLVTSALRSAVERGTGHALRDAGFAGAVAGKSGTTNAFRDAWFVGYSPNLVVGVWVGFDDGRSIGVSGSGAALPIFGSFMSGAQPDNGRADFTVPAGLEVATVGRNDGGRVECGGDAEYFLRGTVPSSPCRSRWSFDRERSRYSSREKLRTLRNLVRNITSGSLRRSGG